MLVRQSVRVDVPLDEVINVELRYCTRVGHLAASQDPRRPDKSSEQSGVVDETAQDFDKTRKTRDSIGYVGRNVGPTVMCKWLAACDLEICPASISLFYTACSCIFKS